MIMYPNLRIQLWKTGIRQNRLAKMIEMDETLLSRIVNGYRTPSPEFRKKISAILDSDELWLFQEAENPSAEEHKAPNAKTTVQS
jgi:transcriptional regulator with XRE-family HTH domain